MGDYKSDKKNTRFYGLKLSRNTDAELIEWLDSKGSIQGYMKDLIRTDMMKGDRKMTFDLNPYHVTMDSFDQFDPWPTNWEEIADFLNTIIDSRIESMVAAHDDFSDWLEIDQQRECHEISEKVWEEYCAGDLDNVEGCPVIIPRD